MAARQATAERGGSRGATAGTDQAGCGPIVEVPRCFLSTLKAGCVSSAQTGLETAFSRAVRTAIDRRIRVGPRTRQTARTPRLT
jgi:hypothetical protein